MKRSQSSSIDLTTEALDLYDELLIELAGVGAECDRLRAEARTKSASWGQLFDVMPMACLVTDNTGQIKRANAAAGRLLNAGVKHLCDRQLILFSHERTAFAATISRLQDGDSHLRVQLVLRPRERKPAAVDATVVASAEEGSSTYLWCLTPAAADDKSSDEHLDEKHNAQADDTSNGGRWQPS